MASSPENPSSKVTHRILPNIPTNTRKKVNNGGKRQRSPGKERGLVNWSDWPLVKSDLLLQFAKEIVDIMSDEDMVETETVDSLKATTCDIEASRDMDDSDLCESSEAPRTPEWIRNPGRRTDWASLGAIVDPENDSSKKDKRPPGPKDKLDKKDCAKNTTIEVHPRLLRQWYMAGLRARAAAAACRVAERPTGAPRAVLWSTRPPQLFAEPRQSRRCLYVLEAAEAAPLLARRALPRLVARRRHLGQVTLVVLDTAHYFRKPSSNGCIGKNVGPGTDLDIAIAELLVSQEVDTVVVHSAEELETLVLNYTRAVAEEPLKLAQRRVDDQAEFYMRGDNKNCVVVDQQGNGLANLWQQMLSVFPHSSLEAARAVAQHAPSPRAMARAASSPEGVDELAAVGVSRSGAASARPRRLGPELARRLAAAFHHLDGDILVE